MTRPGEEPIHSVATIANRVRLSDLRENVLNVATLASGTRILIVKQAGDIQAFSEVCPHLGGDMTQARYCARERTLQCPWHGYIFSSQDGRFLENPNERLTALIRKPSAHFHPDKTPRYRLPAVPFVIDEGHLSFERKATA